MKAKPWAPLVPQAQTDRTPLIARAVSVLAMLIVMVAVALGIYWSFFNFSRADNWDEYVGVLLWDVGWARHWPLFAVVGAPIVWWQPRNRVGWLCLMLGVSSSTLALPSLGLPFVSAGVFKFGLALSGALAGWWWVLALPTALILTFPDGRFQTRRWPLIVGLGALPGLMQTFQSFGRPSYWTADGVQLANVLAAPWVTELFALLDRDYAVVLYLLPNGLGLAALVTATLLLHQRWHYARGVIRQQISWFLCAVGACAGIMVLSLFVGVIAPWFGESAEVGAKGFSIGILGLGILVPLAIAIAILRYRLWDITLVVRRSLMYGALSAGVACSYVLIMTVLGRVFRNDDSPWVAATATVISALLALALRDRVQRWINRQMFGHRDEPVTVLAQAGRAIESAASPQAALDALALATASALRLPHSAITISGDPPSDLPVRFNLLDQGESVGELAVAPRAPGEPLDDADLRTLEAVAAQAAGLARRLLLERQLSDSRRQIVSAREEERRRLRRDLHDDLGPTLASQALKLDAAIDAIPSNPPRAQALLASIKLQHQNTLADVRRIVHNLRPPALDEFGLAGALRSCFEQHGADTAPAAPAKLRVQVTAPELPALPAAVEVAAYRIAAEAVANVLAHAGASECGVTLALDAGALHVQVDDNGHGFDQAAATGGVGLRSMRERAAELNGTLKITQLQPGTRIVAALPLGPMAI